MAGDCGYKRKGRKGRSGMKKVSVIIPAYRCAATLRQAIDSALFQEVPLEILVLDEATSALDSSTEQAVMESIESLQGLKTMVIIAHRLTTIKNADLIYEVVEGKVIQRKKEDIL